MRYEAAFAYFDRAWGVWDTTTAPGDDGWLRGPNVRWSRDDAERAAADANAALTPEQAEVER